MGSTAGVIRSEARGFSFICPFSAEKNEPEPRC